MTAEEQGEREKDPVSCRAPRPGVTPDDSVEDDGEVLRPLPGTR